MGGAAPPAFAYPNVDFMLAPERGASPLLPGLPQFPPDALAVDAAAAPESQTLAQLQLVHALHSPPDDAAVQSAPHAQHTPEDAELDRAAAVLARVHVLEARVAMESEANAAGTAAAQPEHGLVDGGGSSQESGDVPSSRAQEEDWLKREGEAIKAEIRRMEEAGRKAHLAALEAARARSASSQSPQTVSPEITARSPTPGEIGLKAEPSPSDLPDSTVEEVTGRVAGGQAATLGAPSAGSSRSTTPASVAAAAVVLDGGSRGASPAPALAARASSPAGSILSAAGSAAPSTASSRSPSAGGSVIIASAPPSRSTSAAGSVALSQSEASSRPRSVLAYASRPSSAAGRSTAQSRPLSRATVMSSSAGRALMEDDATDRAAVLVETIPEGAHARAGELTARNGTRVEPGSVRCPSEIQMSDAAHPAQCFTLCICLVGSAGLLMIMRAVLLSDGGPPDCARGRRSLFCHVSSRPRWSDASRGSDRVRHSDAQGERPRPDLRLRCVLEMTRRSWLCVRDT